MHSFNNDSMYGSRKSSPIAKSNERERLVEETKVTSPSMSFHVRHKSQAEQKQSKILASLLNIKNSK